MIRAMVSGTLYGVPQARTAASGKQYATAKLRADGKDGTSAWCSVIAFGDIADRLSKYMRLAANYNRDFNLEGATSIRATPELAQAMDQGRVAISTAAKLASAP